MKWGVGKHTAVYAFSLQSQCKHRYSPLFLWVGFLWSLFSFWNKDNPRPTPISLAWQLRLLPWGGGLSQCCIWLGGSRRGHAVWPLDGTPLGQEQRVYAESAGQISKRSHGQGQFTSRHNLWHEYHLLAIDRKLTIVSFQVSEESKEYSI